MLHRKRISCRHAFEILQPDSRESLNRLSGLLPFSPVQCIGCIRLFQVNDTGRSDEDQGIAVTLQAFDEFTLRRIHCNTVDEHINLVPRNLFHTGVTHQIQPVRNSGGVQLDPLFGNPGAHDFGSAQGMVKITVLADEHSHIRFRKSFAPQVRAEPFHRLGNAAHDPVIPEPFPGEVIPPCSQTECDHHTALPANHGIMFLRRFRTPVGEVLHRGVRSRTP